MERGKGVLKEREVDRRREVCETPGCLSIKRYQLRCVECESVSEKSQPTGSKVSSDYPRDNLLYIFDNL